MVGDAILAIVSSAICGAKVVSDQLILKRATASRPSGEWNAEDFDVLSDGAFYGAAPWQCSPGPN
jgi:hypothetical protein